MPSEIRPEPTPADGSRIVATWPLSALDVVLAPIARMIGRRIVRELTAIKRDRLPSLERVEIGSDVNNAILLEMWRAAPPDRALNTEESRQLRETMTRIYGVPLVAVSDLPAREWRIVNSDGEIVAVCVIPPA